MASPVTMNKMAKQTQMSPKLDPVQSYGNGELPQIMHSLPSNPLLTSIEDLQQLRLHKVESQISNLLEKVAEIEEKSDRRLLGQASHVNLESQKSSLDNFKTPSRYNYLAKNPQTRVSKQGRRRKKKFSINEACRVYQPIPKQVPTHPTLPSIVNFERYTPRDPVLPSIRIKHKATKSFAKQHNKYWNSKIKLIREEMDEELLLKECAHPFSVRSRKFQL